MNQPLEAPDGDRVAAGEAPPAPARPQGQERNVVITQWDWADPKAYLHDLVSTDRRNPTVNANGPVYGALEASADYTPVLDPVGHVEVGRARRPGGRQDPRVGKLRDQGGQALGADVQLRPAWVHVHLLD